MSQLTVESDLVLKPTWATPKTVVNQIKTTVFELLIISGYVI